MTSSIFVVLSHGGNFLDGGWQERYWIKGSLVGLAMVLVLLEGVRIVMMTLVELRKFENRKKSKQGHFLPPASRKARRSRRGLRSSPRCPEDRQGGHLSAHQACRRGQAFRLVRL